MNKQVIISVGVLFVVTMAGGMVVHGMILADDYTKLASAGVFRTPEAAQPLFPIMLAAHLILAIGLTWVYRMGRDNRPWLGQGFRFGLAVATLTAIPHYLIYYAVTPMPSDVVAKQIVLDIIVLVVVGIVTAFVNRDPVAARA